ncbi:hypothetical protein BDQ17DRAFT_1410506 [Cyathus striatus]|nr:hypothetical protein BDQ17DRAFT_1410506 [Cyathus striatus]
MIRSLNDIDFIPERERTVADAAPPFLRFSNSPSCPTYYKKPNVAYPTINLTIPTKLTTTRATFILMERTISDALPQWYTVPSIITVVLIAKLVGTRRKEVTWHVRLACMNEWRSCARWTGKVFLAGEAVSACEYERKIEMEENLMKRSERRRRRVAEKVGARIRGCLTYLDYLAPPPPLFRAEKKEEGGGKNVREEEEGRREGYERRGK